MRATRFELATFWSVARRSIQLSYARIRSFRNASAILQISKGNVKEFLEMIMCLPSSPHFTTEISEGFLFTFILQHEKKLRELFPRHRMQQR